MSRFIERDQFAVNGCSHRKSRRDGGKYVWDFLEKPFPFLENR
jgi:hypothetical protein